MVDETVGIDELFFTNKFGLIFENRMYVVSVRYREDRPTGAMSYLPLKVAQAADFIVDISGETVLKQRYQPEYKNKSIGKPINIALEAIEGSFAAILFAGLENDSMSPTELMEIEPRFKPEFTASTDNVFSG